MGRVPDRAKLVRAGRLLAALCVLCLCSGRLAASPPDASQNQQERFGARSEIDQEDAERLRALGYVEFSPDLPESAEEGVTQWDQKRAASGHNLIVSQIGCRAQLFDLAGRALRSWHQSECRQWWGAALMRNGDLLVNGSLLAPPLPQGQRPSGERQKKGERFVARIASTGETVWLREMRSHHHLDLTPQGEVLILTEATLSEGRAALVGDHLEPSTDGRPQKLHDNSLLWLSADGTTLDTLSLIDAVTTGDADFPFSAREKLLEGPDHVGLFHCNSAYAMNQPHLSNSHPLFSEHNVLLTSRNQDRIFVVNRRTRSLVWAWGEAELQAPHGGTWLANGHVLVFDNGIHRDHSRVLEVDPKTGEIVWQYPAENGAAFSTKTRGMAQRLDNGNTLIVESNAGRAFEVTPRGHLVWEYRTPISEDKNKRPVIISLRRYPDSWIENLAAAAPP